jgi:hypothetical protein
VDSILNSKYCDIDSSFGLHDYQVEIELRNSQQVFFSEIFRKVFTKLDPLARDRRFADFKLLQTQSSQTPLFRFKGRPFY